MSLNIKNPKTTALVRELAERTGMSQTQAVEVAVSERLASLDAQAEKSLGAAETKRDTATRLLKRIRDSLSEGDHGALAAAEAELFDHHGLPK